MVEIIPNEKRDAYEEHSAPILQPQQPTNLANLMAIADQVIAIPGVRDLIIEYADDIDDLISEHAGSYKTIAYGYVKLKYPDIHKALTCNPDTSVRSQDAPGRDIDDRNPLDDNNPEKTYDIPDTEILDEVRNFACSLHLSGYGWSAISDQIFSKYDIDWNPLKIKDIVLKNLAWNHRTLQATPKIAPEASQPSQAQAKEIKYGIFRRFIHWLY